MGDAIDTINNLITLIILLFVLYVIYKIAKALELFKSGWGAKNFSGLLGNMLNEFTETVVTAPQNIANTIYDIYKSAKGDAKARERLQYGEGYFDYEKHIYYGQKVEPGTTKYFATPLGNLAKVTVFDIEKFKEAISKAGYTSYANYVIAQAYPEAFKNEREGWLIPYPQYKAQEDYIQRKWGDILKSL